MAKSTAITELDEFKQAVDSLDSAYQQFKKGKLIDASMLKGIESTFAFTGEAYDNFQNAVMTGEKNLQPYFNAMINEYARQKLTFDDLSESTRNWYEQQLVATGFTKKSAHDSVEAMLKEKSALESSVKSGIESLNKTAVEASDGYKKYSVSVEDVDKLTVEEITNLIKLNSEIEKQKKSKEGIVQLTDEEIEALKVEGIALDQAGQAIVYFVLKKELSKDLSMRNEDDINYLLQLIQLAGLGAESIEHMKYVLTNYSSFKESYEAAKKARDDFKANNAYAQGDAGYQRRLAELQADVEYYQQMQKEAEEINDNWLKELQDKYKDLDVTSYLNGAYAGAVDSSTSAAEEAYQKAKELLEKLLALYDAELAAGTITVQEYVEKSRRLIEEYYNSGKIKAADYYGYLESLAEKEKAQYDKVISAVQKLIQKQIKDLEKQKEAIEENYNEQIEAIQKKIDAIQDENEEIDKNMALQKAQ
jgi:hypothetical protein